MDVTSIQPRPAATDVPLEQLLGNSRLSEEQKVAEVTRQFEAILLRQILQNTQKTVIPSEFSDNSTAASIYHDLVTQQLADSISKSGTVGLAKTLQHQLTRQLRLDSTAGHDCETAAQPTAHAATSVTRPPSCSPGHPLRGLNPESPVAGATALTYHERTAATPH